MSKYIPADLRREVMRDAGHRCGYCQTDENLTGIPLSVEHIVPRSRGGLSARENLWMACRPCNEFKGAEVDGDDPHTGERVLLFNPRMQRWDDHFAWDEDGAMVVGLTPAGRATVVVLHMNWSLLVLARKRWVLDGWHPPTPSS